LPRGRREMRTMLWCSNSISTQRDHARMAKGAHNRSGEISHPRRHRWRDSRAGRCLRPHRLRLPTLARRARPRPAPGAVLPPSLFRQRFRARSSARPHLRCQPMVGDSRDDWNDLLAAILFGVKYPDLEHRKSVLQIFCGFQRAILRSELGLQMTVHHQAVSGRLLRDSGLGCTS
jgi:hypothetical protein